MTGQRLAVRPATLAPTVQSPARWGSEDRPSQACRSFERCVDPALSADVQRSARYHLHRGSSQTPPSEEASSRLPLLQAAQGQRRRPRQDTPVRSPPHAGGRERFGVLAGTGFAVTATRATRSDGLTEAEAIATRRNRCGCLLPRPEHGLLVAPVGWSRTLERTDVQQPFRDLTLPNSVGSSHWEGS
jgi:hypothetical protein